MYNFYLLKEIPEKQNNSGIICHLKSYLFLILLLFSVSSVYSQLNVTSGLTPNQYVENIVGGGVTFSNVTFSCNSNSIASFTTGSNPTNLGFNSGIILSTGLLTGALQVGSHSSNFMSTPINCSGDPQLQALINPYTVTEATILEFDFIPVSDTIMFQYIFASEEYHEWVGSAYNDVFGFFLSGPDPLGGNYTHYNMARVPGTSTPVAINTVNNGHSYSACASGPCSNCSYFVDNCNGTSIVYDGFTTTLTAWAVVVPCQTYHIKLAIGDAGDRIFDSGVFLLANSFTSPTTSHSVSYPLASVIGDYVVEGNCNSASVTFTRPSVSASDLVLPLTLSGSAVHGIDYSFPDSIVIPAGSFSVTVSLEAFLDGLNEGTEQVVIKYPNSFCSFDSIIIHIQDYLPLNISVNSPGPLCSGDSATLIVSVSDGLPAYSFLWNNGNIDSTQTVIPPLTTTYTIQVTDLCNNIVTSDVTVVVNDNPLVSIQFENNPICEGTTIFLNANSNIIIADWQWSSGQIVDSISVTPAVTTTYSVTGTTAQGCSSDTSMTITVFPNSGLIISGDTSICANETTTLSVNNGIPGTVWLWNSGQSTNSITVSPASSTHYIVTATTPLGCTSTAQLLVSVDTIPLVSVSAPVSTICQGSSVTLTAGSSVAGSTYLWNTNSTNQQITVAPNTSRWYRVTATTPNGCTGSAALYIYVTPNPFLTISSSPVEICELNSATLSVSSSVSGTTWNWSTGSTLSAINVTPLSTTTYSVTGTTSAGCTATAQITIPVNPLPVVQILGPSGIICSGSNIQLDATSTITGTTWQWNTGQSGSPVTVTPLANTTYSVTGTTPLGCTASADILISVISSPALTLTALPSMICPGDTSVISVSGNMPGTTWEWNTGEVTASIIVAPNTSSVYRVTGTAPNGCTSTALILLNVHDQPVQGIQASPLQICLGDSTTLTALTTIPGTTFLWSTGETTNPIIVAPIVTTTYSVTATSPINCTGSAEIEIVVSPVPIIEVSPDSSLICAGDTVQLSATSDTPGTSWHWSTGNSTNPVSVNPNTSTTYTVTGTTPQGCTASSEASVTVLPNPVQQITSSSNAICIQGTVTLTAVENVPGTHWLWSTGDTINPITVNVNATTTYSVTGTSPDGCTGSADITINVQSQPNITFDSLITSVCQQQPLNLSVSCDVPVDHWIWNTGDTTNPVTVIPNVSTTYSVTGTTSSGCSASAQFFVTVHPFPQLSLAVTQTNICFGTSAIITASSNITGTTWLWNTGETINPITVSPDTNSTFLVIGTSPQGCSGVASIDILVYENPVDLILSTIPVICNQDSSVLTVVGSVPGTTWQWSTGETQSSITVSPLVTTTYSVTGTSPPGCTGSAEIILGVYPQPVIAVFADTTNVCAGTQVSLLANSSIPGTTWLWSTGDTASAFSVNPVTTTIYSVTGTTPDGCEGSAEVQVLVLPQPLNDITVNSGVICENQSVVLTANGGLPGNTWLWNTGHSTNPVSVNPMVTTTYSVTATSIQGCTASAELTLVVEPNPVQSIQASDIDICSGESSLLTAVSSIPGVTWFWSDGQTTNPITVSPLHTTNYSVTVTSPIGCTGLAQIQINVYNNPAIVISSSAPEMCIGESIDVTATSNVPGTTWLWSTGETSNPINVSPAATTMYYVTGTTPQGCTSSAYKFIIVQRYPIDSLYCAANEICSGDLATIHAYTSTLGTTFIWNTGSVNNPLMVNPTATTTYTVTGTTPFGCVGTAEIQLTVRPYPVISISTTDPSICIGSSSTLQANGNIYISDWLWNTGQTTDNIVVNPSFTTVYNVIGSTLFGCSDTAQLVLTVNNLPVSGITASSNEICRGDSSVLTANELVPGSVWLWSTGEITKTITVYPLTTTTYSVTGTSPAGCTSTAEITITVHQTPDISVSASSTDICSGDNITLNSASNLAGTIWLWNTGQINGSFSLTPIATTTYTVTGTTAFGCSGTGAVTVNVHPIPVIQLVTPAGNYCAGSPRTITATSNIQTLNYEWSNSEVGTSIVVIPTQNSVYSVTGTSTYGCSASASVQLSVIELPNVNTIASDTSVCYGSGTTLYAITNAVGANFQWSDGCITSVNNVLPVASTHYVVTVTDVFGCTGSADLLINVMPQPQISVNPFQSSVCKGTSVSLTASSNHPNTSYVWSNGSLSNPATVTPLNSTMYSVTGTDILGCSGVSYAIVNVLNVPQITITPSNLTICSMTEVPLVAQSSIAGTTYIWNTGDISEGFSVNPVTTTIYQVTGTAPNGCTGSAQSQINVHAPPVFYVMPGNPHICIGQSVTLAVIGGTQFTWTPSVPFDLPSGSQVTITPETTTQYQIQGTDLYGCTGETSVTVTVHEPPVVDFTTDPDPKCAGNQVQYFSLCIPQDEISAYSWNFGNPSSGVANTSGSQNPIHVYNDAGTYWVSLEVTSIYGCTASLMKPDYVCVHPNPVAAFVRTPDIIDLATPQVNVYNQAIGVVSFLYDFGDPASGQDNYSNLENPVHTYSGPGDFWIWQYVTNEWGCVDSTSHRVIIEPSWEIYIPNAFSPNADGVNDNFYPTGYGIDLDYFEMYIYNRWGEEIFSTKNIQEGWDGSVKNSNSIAKPDVYVYIIKIMDVFKHEQQFVGNITVLR